MGYIWVVIYQIKERCYQEEAISRHGGWKEGCRGNNASISDYFNIFVDSEDFEDMAMETNRYAEQYFQKNPNLSRCSRFRKWVSTTAAEGVEVTGSVLQYSLMSDWDTSPIANIRARYRFISGQILLLLHSTSVYIVGWRHDSLAWSSLFPCL
jgi:hypothetical protein